MSRSAKDKSLHAESVREIIDEVLSLKTNDNLDVSMNISSKQQEDDSIDVINLLEPRLTSTVTMNIQNRSTISSEALYTNFCEQTYLTHTGENMRTKASKVSGLLAQS